MAAVDDDESVGTSLKCLISKCGTTVCCLTLQLSPFNRQLLFMKMLTKVNAPTTLSAGSLTNLAKAPASTVQILGAEKALFRALKTKGNTPKYGLIFHSSFIGRAKQRNKGRISRYLANKCSIATRIDAFMDSATNVFGEKMRDQV
jgi:hypothetical protein